MTEETHDSVNHPAHYTSDPSGVECIEITRHRTFNIGNAIKYLWRAGLKDEDTTVEDLRKAIWYIEDEIKRLSPTDPQPLLGVVKPDFDDGGLFDKTRRYGGLDWYASGGPIVTANPSGSTHTVTYRMTSKRTDDGDDGEAQAVPC